MLAKVSVVISLFNYENYIGECLESILAQTFQDFEVIVVDDCSTDNSFAVAESYIPKFGGRLKVLKTKTNSGGGGEPRNRGFEFARGEYVFFMDADDAFTKTALEEMYTLAKKYDAEVVYCERYFMSSGRGQEFKNNIHLADSRIQKIPPVDSPTLETDDLTVRIEKAVNYRYWVTPWLRLVSRNLLLENEIKFPSLIGSNDIAWTFKILLCAKRFLRIPNACYIRRMHAESVSLRKRTTAQYVHKWMDRTIRSLRDMDDFLSELEFFRTNPAYRYKIIDSFAQMDFSCIFKYCANVSPLEVYGIFREKFGEYLGEHDVLVATLCALVNTQQKILTIDRQNFEQFASKAQRRIFDLENEVRLLKSKE